jgi:molybdenum cofactor cytidylyltransferase
MTLSLAIWTGILLAAGRGRRFDPDGVEDKLQQTLPDGNSVALTAAQHLSSVMKQVVVVVRPDNRALLQEFQHQLYEVVICHDADQGMAASLTCGLRQAARSKGWIIALADMPFVRALPSQRSCVSWKTVRILWCPCFRGSVATLSVSQVNISPNYWR